MPEWLRSLFAAPTPAPDPYAAGLKSLNTPQWQHPRASNPEWSYFGKPVTARNVDEAAALLSSMHPGGQRRPRRGAMRRMERRQQDEQFQFNRKYNIGAPPTIDRYIPPEGVF